MKTDARENPPHATSAEVMLALVKAAWAIDDAICEIEGYREIPPEKRIAFHAALEAAEKALRT